MLYSIAKLKIEIDFKYEYGKDLCHNYRVDLPQKPDFSVSVSEEMIEHERELDIYNSPDSYLESLAVYRQICNKAFEYDCMFMHCSALSFRGNGVIFTAPSGTGKSTHAALWRREFGGDVAMVNDDKPLLRIIGGKMYVCGTPWDGKHHLSSNITVPLRAVVILSQGAENHITKADKRTAVYTLLNQTIRPEEPALMLKTLNMTEFILKNVPVYALDCNISREAALTSFNAVKENFI